MSSHSATKQAPGAHVPPPARHVLHQLRVFTVNEPRGCPDMATFAFMDCVDRSVTIDQHVDSTLRLHVHRRHRAECATEPGSRPGLQGIQAGLLKGLFAVSLRVLLCKEDHDQYVTESAECLRTLTSPRCSECWNTNPLEQVLQNIRKWYSELCNAHA